MFAIKMLVVFIIAMFLLIPVGSTKNSALTVEKSYNSKIDKKDEASYSTVPSDFSEMNVETKSSNQKMDMSHIAIGEIGIIKKRQKWRNQNHYLNMGTIFNEISTQDGYMARLLMYGDPVVIMGPLSYNGGAPSHVRLRGLSRPSAGKVKYTYRIEEWKYLDGAHAEEYFSYIAIERGIHVLPDGTVVEANKIEIPSGYSWGARTKWFYVKFDYDFDSAPILFVQIQTANDNAPCILRVKDVTKDGFYVTMQEEEAADNIHGKEIIGYIAFSKTNTVPETTYPIYSIDIGSTKIYAISKAIDNNARKVFSISQQRRVITIIDEGGGGGGGGETQVSVPAFIVASVTTTMGGDPIDIRYYFREPSNGIYDCYMFLQEEKSKDEETAHSLEDVWILSYDQIVTDNFWRPILAGRSINIYIVKIGMSESSYVYNKENVVDGILEAVNHARTRSLIKVPQEIISVHYITTMEEFDYIVKNPPLRAVLINTHGEVLPLPDSYWELAPSQGGGGSSGGGGGGTTIGCPYVAISRNGTWHTINNILPRSEAIKDFVYDYILLSEIPTPEKKNRYRIAITEFENEIDHIDYVKAIAIDHPDNFQLAVSPEGEILTYMYTKPPTMVIDSNGEDIFYDVALMDNECYTGLKNDYVIATFFNVSPGIMKLFIGADNRHIDWSKVVEVSTEAVIIKLSLVVQIWDEDKNEWVNLSIITPRNEPYIYGIDLTKYFVNKYFNKTICCFEKINKKRILSKLRHIKRLIKKLGPQNITIRILFTRPHALDLIALESTPIKEEIKRWKTTKIRPAILRKAYGSNSDIKIKKKLRKPDNKTTTIEPGQNITMEFIIPKAKKNTTLKREILLIVRGYYESKLEATTTRAVFYGDYSWQPTKWEDFVEKIGDNCRNYGWTFTHIAGYPLKYVSNTRYIQTPLEIDNAIKKLLGYEIKIINTGQEVTYRHINGKYFAYGGYPFEASYISSVRGSFSIPKMEMTDNIVLMDRNGNNVYVCGFVIKGMLAGFFAFNGLSKDALCIGSSATQYDHDFIKGYVSIANAIECARSYLSDPILIYTEVTEAGIYTLGESYCLMSLSMRPGEFDEFGNGDKGILLAISFSGIIINQTKTVKSNFISMNINAASDRNVVYVWKDRLLDYRYAILHYGTVELSIPYADKAHEYQVDPLMMVIGLIGFISGLLPGTAAQIVDIAVSSGMSLYDWYVHGFGSVTNAYVDGNPGKIIELRLFEGDSIDIDSGPWSSYCYSYIPFYVRIPYSFTHNTMISLSFDTSVGVFCYDSESHHAGTCDVCGGIVLGLEYCG